MGHETEVIIAQDAQAQYKCVVETGGDSGLVLLYYFC